MLNDMNPIARLTSAARSVFGMVANLGLMAGVMMGFRRPLLSSFSDALNRTSPEPEYAPQTMKLYEFLGLLHNNPWVNGLGYESRQMFKNLILDELAQRPELVNERHEILNARCESSARLDETYCDLADIENDFKTEHHYLTPNEILNILTRVTYQVCSKTRGPRFSMQIPEAICLEINILAYNMTDDHLKRDARAFLTYGSEAQYDQPLPDDGNWPRQG